MANFKRFPSALAVCEWLNKGIYSRVIGITQNAIEFTVFYEEYGEEDFIRDMAEFNCVPDVLVPSITDVPPRTSQNVHKTTTVESIPVY